MSFSSDLQRFANKAGLTMDEAVRGVVLEIGNSVIELSPVDTGRFRANWQHNSISPASGVLNRFDKSANGAQSKAALASVVAAIRAGNVEYLTNNLPYGQELENGSSQQQAPNGMVRITITRFNRIVGDVARSL